MKNIMVWGVGGAGVRVVKALAAHGEASGVTLFAVDTDANELNQCPLDPARRIQCDQQWRSGGGCGGDVMKGQRSLARERSRFGELMSDAELVIVVGGLGGGTATGGVGVLAGVAKSLHIPLIFMLTLPFSFEGHGRARVAEEGVRELLPIADALLALPNDLLFAALPAETPALDAFACADAELAGTVLGVAALFAGGNLLAADMGDLSAILKDKKSYSAIGVGRAAADEFGGAAQAALSRLVDSPFLGGAAKLEEADAVLLNISGGSALTLGEVQRTLTAAGRLAGENARRIWGANIDPALGNQVVVTALCVKFDDRVAADDMHFETATPRRPRRRKDASASSGLPSQPELTFMIPSSGIFETATQTVINGVNLDIPTFMRQQITVDTGE